VLKNQCTKNAQNESFSPKCTKKFRHNKIFGQFSDNPKFRGKEKLLPCRLPARWTPLSCNVSLTSTVLARPTASCTDDRATAISQMKPRRIRRLARGLRGCVTTRYRSIAITVLVKTLAVTDITCIYSRGDGHFLLQYTVAKVNSAFSPSGIGKSSTVYIGLSGCG